MSQCFLRGSWGKNGRVEDRFGDGNMGCEDSATIRAAMLQMENRGV